MRLSSHVFALVYALAVIVAGTAVDAAPMPQDIDAEGHTTEEMNEAKEEFESIDTDKDGFITKGEIMAMEDVPEMEEIEEFFDTYDSDKDDKVTFAEIVAADKVLRDEADDGEESESN